VEFVEELLGSASGTDRDGRPILTSSDVARALGQRLAESKATNPEFATSFMHRVTGMAKFVIYLFCPVFTCR
jgi:hypothetical protein